MNTRRGWNRLTLIRLLLSIAACLAALLISPAWVIAQDEEKKQEYLDVFLPADREIKKKLDEAKEAIDEENYNLAVERLGFILASDDVEDFFIEPSEEGNTQISLKAEARRLIANLPRRGRDAYQLQFADTARFLFNEAIKNRDFHGLTEITRKYFHTPSGYESALLIGRQQLGQGQPLSAALVLQQLLDAPADVLAAHDPEFSLLLAAAWLQAGSEEKAQTVLVNLAARTKARQLRIGAQQIELFDREDQAVAWLRDAMGKIEVLRSLNRDGWWLHRGDSARNATSIPGTPLRTLRWKLPTPNDPDEQELLADQGRDYAKQRIAAIPAAHPLVVRYRRHNSADEFREVVLTRTPQRLLAVDLQSGLRVWYYVPLGTESLRDRNRISSGQSSLGPRAAELKQRTWLDAPFGQLASDGQRVFFVDDLFTAEKNIQQVRIVAGGGRIINPNSPKPYNQLVALGLARQGSRLWTIGGEDGGSEPDLAGSFFLGPPLPLMDKLYALAEKRGDIRLVVLDPNDGNRYWEQQLCGVDQQAILDDWTRRLGGATPSFADGVLVCPTSAGAVVGVDLAKRSLLWGFQYLKAPENPSPRGGFWPQNRSRRQANKPGQSWADSTVAIAEGRVVFTPVETDQLFCLDLLTGKKLWSRDRGSSLYVAGIHERNVLLVGATEVFALRLTDGEVAWKATLPEDAVPSGRGFVADKHFYLPLTTAELLKIELAGGKRASIRQTNGVLGNVISYGDTVISQNPTELRAFYRQEALEKLVPQRLAANPNDSWALARQGELLLADGQRAEALRSLRKAYQLDPQDEVKALLVETLLGALEEDFAANRQLAVEVDDLIDRPDQRDEYLRLMAQGLQQVGELTEAFGFYLKIVDETTTNDRWTPQSTQPPAMKQVGRTLEVREDRWWQGRLSSLLAVAEPAHREVIDREVKRRLDAAIAEGSTSSLRQFLNYFGAHPTAGQAQLALAKRLIASEDYLEAELLLSALVDSDADSLAGPATAQMARLLQVAEEVEESAAMYRRLGGRFADVDCGDDKTGAEWLAAVDGESAVHQRLNTKLQWPSGRTQQRPDGPASRYSSYQRIYASRIDEAAGPVSVNSQIMLDRQRRVILQDGRGDEQISFQLSGSETTRYYSSNYSLTHARRNGHLMLLSLGYEIFSVDLMRASNNASQRVLWRMNLSRLSGNTSSSGRHVQPKVRTGGWGGERYYAGDSDGRPIASFGSIHHRGVVLRRLGQLLCVDPIRPDVVYWARDGIDDGTEIFGDREIILTVKHGEAVATAYRAVDGVELGNCTLPDAKERWTKVGPRILTWRGGEGEQVTLSLQQPWDVSQETASSDPVVWSHKFIAGAKGTLVGREKAIIVEPSGKLTAIDLTSGEIHFTQQLQPEEELAAVHAIGSGDHLIVVVSEPIDDAPEGVNVQPAPGGYGPLGQNSPQVKGRAYALNPTTGKHLWPVPAVIEHYGLPLDQPAELPVLTFLRNVSPNNGGGSRAWKTSVLCLDKRDGRIVFDKSDIAGQTQVYRIQTNEAEHEISIMLPGKTFTIKLTDDPRPPSPPAQTGSASSLASAPDPRKFIDPTEKEPEEQPTEKAEDGSGEG